MTFFKKVFNKQQKQEPKPLRVDGVKPAPMTTEPDEAELAAMALLEHMQEVQGSKNDGITESSDSGKKNAPHDAAYFKALASRIKQAHEAAHQRTQRFLAFCEQELKKHDLPKEGPGSLGLLRAELFKRLDVVERHGGELKTRWQHCLATVLVRLNDGMPPVSLDENEDVNK
jgi:hypothetical protein